MRNFLGRSVRNGRSTAAAASFRTPKVAAIDYSATVDAARIALTAQYEYAIRDWSTESVYQSGGSAYTFAQAVRSANPATQLGYYVILSQINSTTGGSFYTPFDSIINGGGTDAKPWFTYAAGTSNKTNFDTSFANTWEINQTAYTTPDSNGNHWPQAAAIQYASNFSQMRSASLIDFVMNDNCWYTPRADKAVLGGTAAGDINLDGANETCSSGRVTSGTIAAAYRTGYANFWAKLQSLMPGLKIAANSDADTSNNASVSYAEMTGKCDFPLLEGFIGKSYSLDQFSFFTSNMAWYRSAMAARKAGGTVFLLCYINSTSNQPLAYRMARYGLGCTMMDDGHCLLADEPGGASMQPKWYDEFAQTIGTPTDTAQSATSTLTGIAGTGVWARRYQNGIVLVNPKDNRGNWMGNATYGGGTLTLVRSSNVVTLTWANLSGHGKQVGDLIKIEGCNNSSFNGIFQLTAVGSTSLTWAQTGTNTSLTAGSTLTAGYFATQATVNLTGQGYKRFITTNDTHDNYDGTLGSGTPVYTSQNDGSSVTTIKLWSQDAVLLLNA